MTFRKVIVLGAGAIGSSVGALLSRRNDVTLVGNREHIQTIRLKGLKMSGDLQETFRLKTDTKISSIPKATLIILATKVYDSKEAITRIKNLIREDTTILVLQNGLGNDKIVEEALGRRTKTTRGIATIAAEFMQPGKIRFWNGKIIIGKSSSSDDIISVFEGSGIDTFVSGHIEERIWQKLIVNCVVNPLTAIFRVKNNEIFRNSLEPVRHAIILECLEVAKAEGISIPSDFEEMIERETSKYTNCSSMCQDIIKRKKTEIEYLNGKIVELAKKHGRNVPVNETLTCMIRFLGEEN